MDRNIVLRCSKKSILTVHLDQHEPAKIVKCIEIPSGYLTVCHGKSPFLIGKPCISMGHLYHGKLLVITRGSRELTDVIDLMATLAFYHDFAVKDWGLSCLQPLVINHGCGKTNVHKTVGDGQCPSISIHDQLRLLKGIAWPLLAKQQNLGTPQLRGISVSNIAIGTNGLDHPGPRSLSGHTMRDTPLRLLKVWLNLHRY